MNSFSGFQSPMSNVFETMRVVRANYGSDAICHRHFGQDRARREQLVEVAVRLLKEAKQGK